MSIHTVGKGAMGFSRVEGITFSTLQLGSIARSGASGGGSTVGAETHVNNELAKVRGFSEGDR